MTTFNFTVRAVDERGAYADRDFSIKVRNTIVDRYVAMSMNGHIYTSPDGDTWTQRINQGYSHSDFAYTNNVVYGNGLWIAPNDKNSYKTSVDGVNWSTQVMPGTDPGNSSYLTPTAQIPRITFVNGRFVLARYEVSGSVFRRVYTSYDGLNWSLFATFSTNLTMGNSGFAQVQNNTVCYGGGKWIVTSGSNNAVIYVSEDEGETWRTVTTQMTNIHNIYYYNGVYFCVGFNSSAIHTSLDGYSWVIQPVETISHIGYSSLLYGNGRLVAIPHRNNVSSGGGTNLDFVMTSVDGRNWTRTLMPDALVTTAISGGARASAIYHNGLFMITYTRVASGKTDIGWVSDNGLDWEKIPFDKFTGAATGLYAIGGIGQD